MDKIIIINLSIIDYNKIRNLLMNGGYLEKIYESTNCMRIIYDYTN